MITDYLKINKKKGFVQFEENVSVRLKFKINNFLSHQRLVAMSCVRLHTYPTPSPAPAAAPNLL
jgi:hypothetical protein